ncbi:transportin MOS14-like [Cucumis melo]|uniref:Transportin MOS14-like n=1 Tax=Cucumis melo TaxID=3656 RepID=A0A1S4E5C1_CUCME|nr:transportin MOS14-like [Cucumis melo]
MIQDEEDVKAIAQLFADMGDSYVELIATGSDESMLIVHALLEVTSDPEYDIASITFNFWHSLQLNLTKRTIKIVKKLGKTYKNRQQFYLFEQTGGSIPNISIGVPSMSRVY